MNVLLREKDLDPEIAARVSLTKGEVPVDVGNYQAAAGVREPEEQPGRSGKTRPARWPCTA